jgi:hypothetical protein
MAELPKGDTFGEFGVFFATTNHCLGFTPRGDHEVEIAEDAVMKPPEGRPHSFGGLHILGTLRN